MSEFIKILLSLSLSGTLLLFVTLFLKQFYKNTFSRCWQYYILLLVALRFLVPVLFNYNITGYLYKMAGNVLEHREVPDESIKDIKEITKTKETEKIEETKETEKIEETKRNKITFIKQEIKNTARKVTILHYILKCVSFVYKNLFFIWLVFVIVFICRNIIAYKKFINYIKVEAKDINNTNILNLLEECEKKLKIKKHIRLYYNPWISSPVLAGFLHPYIIIPEGDIEDEKMFYVFLHELVHYKRKDIFYKWFIQTVICIHWFNPFVRLLGKEINKSCELSCDEAVISMLDKKERRAYGGTLISFVKTKESYKNPLGTITLTEGALQLKERLGAIMDFKKKPVTIKIATIIVTFIICFSFTLSGVYAASNRQDTESNILEQESIADTILKGSDSDTRYYRQRGFYYGSYIFEMGWDLMADESKYYKVNAKVTLRDNSEITVYFDDNVKKYYKDKKVLNAIGGLVSSVKKDYKVVKRPLILRVTYVEKSDVQAYAKKYYKNEDLIGFTALFPNLNKNEQKKYLDKMYNSGRIAFFASVAEYIDKDLVLLYADKSSKKDGKVNFFSVLLDYVQPEDLERYARKSYKSGDVARFAILVGYMTKAEKKNWLAEAKKDNKEVFCVIISEEL